MSKAKKPAAKKPTKTTDKSVQTRDGYDNFLSRVGLRNENTLSGGTYLFNLITRQRVKLESAYRGSWIVGQCIDTVAEDMTRAGIEISTSEGEEDLKDLFNEISKRQIWQSTCHLVKWGRLYGGALAVMQIEGQRLDTPLNLDTVGEGQFKGLVIYDRWQLNPVLQDLIQDGPDMGLPKFYQIVTTLTAANPAGGNVEEAYSAALANAQNGGFINVHHSRVIRYTGIDLPYFQAITEMMWGESVLERLWDRLISFDNATMSAASLIDRANLRTVSIKGLREIVAAGGKAQQGLVRHMEMMRMFQVNEGLTLLDSEDTFASTAYSFAGLSDMMLQFGQQLSGACGIPLVRLFGQSPAGLSATGDADIRMYYDNIKSQQEAKLRNGFDTILKVMWRSTFGKPAPEDMEFTFTPLWQMSATDVANNAKTNTETIIGAHEAGAIDTATMMKELRTMSTDTGLFANITDEMINDAEDEEPPAPAPGDPENPQQPVDPNTGEPKITKPVPSLDKKPKFKWFRK